jgi:hypothetical protein
VVKILMKEIRNESRSEGRVGEGEGGKDEEE